MTIKKLLLIVLSIALVLELSESFDFHDKDVSSDESLWDLYERWRSHHTVSRNLDEKHKRFNVFKTNVMHDYLCWIKGSCWAFSTVVAVEGINQIKTNRLVPLSEQELIDCDTKENQGCNGGLMEYAFEYIKQKGGLTTESYYPYEANDGSCDATKENVPAVSIDGHENVPANDEDALLKAVANQPVSVAIDAGGSDFQFYSE
ncbi:hypothetical protein TSUD_136530, partial [Trifolium subterraneum]